MIHTSTAIRFSKFGGPEVLSYVEMPLAAPGKDEIQIRQIAIGFNYIDVYHRKGVFGPKLPLPATPGVEGVGEVTAIGAEVMGFAIGDRVAYVGGPPGGYARHRNLPAARALHVPGDLDSTIIAASLFKGLTAEYLTHRCVSLQPGDTVLLHAAAGGVGTYASQLLKALGVTVIGTVSTEEKAQRARARGCADVILYSRNDFRDEVKRLTGGKGVRVVYDSVGADTFERSLDCLQPRGTLVSFGESSGPIDPLQIGTLGAKGSLYLTRPSIAHYTADRGEFETAAERLFGAIRDGVLLVDEPRTYPLADAARAHSDVESRRTMGAVVLLP
ncbi:quinone oxidoreductase [Paracoccus sp. PAR01]|uniref:quinone oxidoreductase family protein n=1 Tax=Paracoccus sp. PAR01 TaxID=2769282 RepID=UPI00178116DC|nr:quinone oxidoreductase [Paracoccus sp. PAR01]MBD9529483.1 quinone oxidoreductase [Paracoccus sp. PAR01]